jgi:predicted nucleic acid-binding protein
MGNNRYKLDEVSQLCDKDIFIDANIFIYLFWATGTHSFEKQYASVYRKLLKQRNKLFVDFWVISEIVNSVLRMEYKKMRSDSNFKSFRNSQTGQDALSDICLIIKNEILPKVNIAGKEYDKCDIESLLVVDDLDFTDKHIVRLCRDRSFVLLTNDKDFKDSCVDILSGNRYIF